MPVSSFYLRFMKVFVRDLLKHVFAGSNRLNNGFDKFCIRACHASRAVDTLSEPLVYYANVQIAFV